MEALVVETLDISTENVVSTEEIVCEGAYLVMGIGSARQKYKFFYSVITGRQEPDPKTSNISQWIFSHSSGLLQLTKSHNCITLLTPHSKEAIQGILSKRLINEYNQLMTYNGSKSFLYFLISTAASGKHTFQHIYGVIDSWAKITEKTDHHLQ